jgi:hypothetical protein
MTVYEVDPRTLKRSPPREIVVQGGEEARSFVETLTQRLPPCECHRCGGKAPIESEAQP